MRTTTLLAHCAVIACLALSPDASAGDRPTAPEALDHLAKGKKLYDAGDFDKAIEEFKTGLMVEDAAIFHYDLGECYWQTGDYKAAAYHYQRFVALHATDDRFTDNAKERAAEAQAKQQAETPHAATPTAPVQPPALAPQPSMQSSPSPDWLARVVLGTGAAAVVVGGVFIWDASSLDGDANHSASQQQVNALHDKASTRRVIGVATGISGVVLLGIGGVKLLLDSRAQDNVRTTWNVGVSPNGVMVFGSF